MLKLAERKSRGKQSERYRRLVHPDPQHRQSAIENRALPGSQRGKLSNRKPGIGASNRRRSAGRNQSDVAFEWLDRACAQRDSGLIGTKVDPLLKNLHGDPRFAAFLKKLNLSD